MTDTIQNQKKKRSPALMAALLLLMVSILVMITLAFFLSEDAVTNVFDGGRLDIVLTETEWEPENAQNITPGAVLPKNPRVTNAEEVDAYIFLEVKVPYSELEIESSDPTDQGSSLGIHQKVPMYKFITVDNNGTPDDPSDDVDRYDAAFTSAQSINPGWTLLEVEEDTAKKCFIYRYAHVNPDNANKMMPLMPGATTQYPLFDKIQLVNFNEKKYDPNRNYSVKVDAIGIQTNYLKANNQTTDVPAEVWARVVGN